MSATARFDAGCASFAIFTSPIHDGLLAESAIAARIAHISVIGDARIDNVDGLASALDAGIDEPVGELLIKGYLRWGDGFVRRLSGDFALVIWDDKRRRVSAFRDPFGVRTLVYRQTNDKVWLGTHVRQIIRTFDTSPKLDDQMVTEHLSWRYKSLDRTFFHDVRYVPPGHMLTVNESGVRVCRYWCPPMERISYQPNEYLTEFRRLFIRSVERRLRSKAAVVVHVSGGLDSSCIAVVADHISKKQTPPCPSIWGAAGSYKGFNCDEGEFVDAVCAHISFPVERWDATAAESTDLTDPLADLPGGRLVHTGGTTGDTAIAENHGAKTILSGTGGDQLGSSSGIVQDMIAQYRWFSAVRELWFFAGATTSSRLARTRYLLAESFPPLLRQLNARLRIKSPGWLTPEFRDLAGSLATPSTSTLDFQSYVQQHVWERISSAYAVREVEAQQRHGRLLGIQYGFPFLDTDLVRFVLAIPYQGWPRPGPFVRLHRDAMRDLLPRKITNRFGKAEFTSALINRIRVGRSIIDGIFAQGEWASEKYVDREPAWQFCRSVIENPHLAAPLAWRQVWAIATLEIWLRRNSAYALDTIGEVRKNGGSKAC